MAGEFPDLSIWLLHLIIITISTEFVFHLLHLHQPAPGRLSVACIMCSMVQLCGTMENAISIKKDNMQVYNVYVHPNAVMFVVFISQIEIRLIYCIKIDTNIINIITILYLKMCCYPLFVMFVTYMLMFTNRFLQP